MKILYDAKFPVQFLEIHNLILKIGEGSLCQISVNT